MISKAYFICGPRYVRYDASADAVDLGYPKEIAGNWTRFKELGFDGGIDAAVDWSNGSVYFFKGAQYVRYNIDRNSIDTGYPLLISDQWPTLAASGFAEGIDAGVNWGNGKVYFFKGTNYVRYDIATDRVDEGFPRSIAEGWRGFKEAAFDSNIDAAINCGNGKAYFFKDDKYLRYDLVTDQSDEGYPGSIGNGWPTLAATGFATGISAIWSRVGAPGSAVDFSYLSDGFFQQLKGVCSRLRCKSDDLLGVMESESGVRPYAQHPKAKATGLIQFMPDTLRKLGWDRGPDEFSKLTAEEQLGYVEKFFTPNIAYDLNSAGRLYQATFLPATLAGSDENTVIAAPGGPNAFAYKDNIILDTNRDGTITVSDLTARIDHVRHGDRWTALMQRLSST